MPESMIQIAPSLGWDKTAIITNDTIELIVTLDVGPRIISYRLRDGTNIFKTFDEQLGGSGEQDWQIRGGHRLWLAPESGATYHPDNHPVTWQQIGTGGIRITAPAEPDTGVTKSLELEIEPTGSAVRVSHRITAYRDLDEPVAAWALTVFREGGVASVPQPKPAPHPGNAADDAGNGYLPNRSLTLWPYTELNDSRFSWESNELLISHKSSIPGSEVAPTKIGFLHQAGHASYRCDHCEFSKSVPFDAHARYPDFQSNLEVYTDGEILEIETLSPLRRLKAGQFIQHSEQWSLNTVIS